MSTADAEKLRNSFIGFYLFNVAQLINSQAVKKMQGLTLRTHTRTVVADKASLKRNVSWPIIQKFFCCGWCFGHNQTG